MCCPHEEFVVDSTYTIADYMIRVSIDGWNVVSGNENVDA
jgi:hypothetical protein